MIHSTKAFFYMFDLVFFMGVIEWDQTAGWGVDTSICTFWLSVSTPKDVLLNETCCVKFVACTDVCGCYLLENNNLHASVFCWLVFILGFTWFLYIKCWDLQHCIILGMPNADERIRGVKAKICWCLWDSLVRRCSSICILAVREKEEVLWYGPQSNTSGVQYTPVCEVSSLVGLLIRFGDGPARRSLLYCVEAHGCYTWTQLEKLQFGLLQIWIIYFFIFCNL